MKNINTLYFKLQIFGILLMKYLHIFWGLTPAYRKGFERKDSAIKNIEILFYKYIMIQKNTDTP